MSTVETTTVNDTGHRFSDVAGEPGTMLAPIEGYAKEPLVSIDDACEPLIRNKIVPRLETYLYVVKQRTTNPSHGLTVDQSAAIALYTVEWTPYQDSLYYILNRSLRTEDRGILKPWFRFLRLIFSGLSRLPAMNATVYRGVRFPSVSEYEKYRVEKEIVWWGFSSCSTEQAVALKEQFLGTDGRRTLFEIKCLQGFDISQHSYFKKEHEVLLFPAIRVQVTRCEPRNGLYVIHLREIQSPISLLEHVPPAPVKYERLTSEAKGIRRLFVSFRHSTSNPSKLPSQTSVESDRGYNEKLNEYLARSRHRAEVSLIGELFNDLSMEVVVQQVMIESQCRELYFRENGLTHRGASVLARALRTNRSLQRLFISQNQLGDEGAKVLAEALSQGQNTTLRELCLGKCEVADEGMMHLATMLESNTTLTHLYLPTNQISDQGFQQLMKVLTGKNQTIQLLSLEWNKFGSDESVQCLTEMLNLNRRLTELNLSSCRFTGAGAKQLKDLSRKYSHLKLICK